MKSHDRKRSSDYFVSACSDQETDEYPLRGLSNIRKLTYSIDPSVSWSEPLWQALGSRAALFI